MILKKFYGNTVKKAREKAFDRLGQDCIVLESKKATDGQDACVTVMMDNKKEDILKDPSKEKASKGNGTYSRKDLFPKSIGKMKETVTKGFSNLAQEEEPSGPAAEETGSSLLSASNGKERKDDSSMSKRSTSLYQQKPDQEHSDPGKESPDFSQRFSSNLQESPVSQEVKALHRRFDHMEKLLSDALISANLEYVSHPAFQQLLNTGMQATTVSGWFETVLNKGIDPYEQSQSFMYELADIVRSALSFALPEAPVKNLLFVGPSGSGKTSLIMKLATHPDYMLNKSVALISVEPDKSSKTYSPLKLFAKDMELPYYTISDGVEMSSLSPHLEEFNHVLFDTPSLSLHQETAFRNFWQIRQMLSSVTPLEIHYTVNATLERYYFKESYAANHPLQPDYLAITHLDETDKWGHLIPFINGLGASVRYVSQGPGMPDNLQTFKPEWFAEKILSES